MRSEWKALCLCHVVSCFEGKVDLTGYILSTCKYSAKGNEDGWEWRTEYNEQLCYLFSSHLNVMEGNRGYVVVDSQLQ
jgi:hypothetical protein